MQDMTFSSAPGFPILSLIILAPLLAAVAAALMRDPRQARKTTQAGAATSLVLSIVALVAFRADFAGMQMTERLAWLPSLGIDYALGIDGISVLFLPMTALVFLAIQWVAPEATQKRNRWVDINLLILLSATLGAFAATDAILFFVFFEMALVPGYFLIKLSGTAPDPARAARNYMVVMLLGSLPVLAGLVMAGLGAAEVTGQLSFDMAALSRFALPEGAELAVFAFLAFGFAIKAPALPLHLWVGASVAASPVSMMAWLLGVKLGTYGFLRFVIPLAPGAAAEYAPWVIGVEVVAILYAGLIALGRRDLRSLLVFSSIGHVGLMTAAAFSGTADGWRGAIMMMLNAGIATAGLALCIGMIERRLGHADVRAMGGLIASAPRLTAVVFVAGLALIGVPGTSGFVGEILSLKGVFDAGWGFGLLAVSGVVLGAGYFLTAYQRGFLGVAARPAVAAAPDLQGRERIFGAGIIVLIVGTGLFPGVPESLTRATVAAQIDRQTTLLADRQAASIMLAAMPETAAGREDM
ncbi:complex I subunit 4 family protein [Roseovarius autotrophicus]|uniref:complex I subunit 4 family protein n=1 Tax=Roseovarius autotrophicus TaxID=2824121 RepID=UPI001B372754|nr:NADH-quinone oxidoreductase subunit M [Roseovarius autotrophicus]